MIYAYADGAPVAADIVAATYNEVENAVRDTRLIPVKVKSGDVVHEELGV
jgi:hypothetical protein